MASQGRCTPSSGECGHGKLEVKVECIKIDKQNNSTRPVDLIHCDSKEVRSVYELYKSTQCYLPCDNFEWRPISETMCSCEDGFKKYTYACHDRLTGETVNEGKCQGVLKPVKDRVKCDLICYKWSSSHWSEVEKKDKFHLFTLVQIYSVCAYYFYSSSAMNL